jgi:PleD family two-component response regulator
MGPYSKSKFLFKRRRSDFVTEEEGTVKILVVDDEKIITMHLEELLSSMGYNVVGTASNAQEAIEQADLHGHNHARRKNRNRCCKCNKD